MRLDGYVRHRRSSLALSLALICFVIAGGRLTGASILWGSVTIQRAWVLYVAAFLAFVYIRWEFAIARHELGILKLFAKDFAHELLGSPSLNARVRQMNPDFTFGPKTELRVGIRELPSLYVDYRTQTVQPFVLEMSRASCLREVIRASYRAIRFHQGFVELVVPEILFWVALACAIGYTLAAALDGAGFGLITEPELS
jgi:hypothetical protein